MTAPPERDVLETLNWAPKLIFLVVLLVLSAIAFWRRNWARAGGKIGRRSKTALPPFLPEGFSRVECREIVNFAPPEDARGYRNLKSYVREAAVHQPGLIHIFHVAGCKTLIEIPVAMPDYDRIDVTEALALLRELPDPRLVLRLQLSDIPSFLDPWSRKQIGRDDVFQLGASTNLRLVVLYLPDRALGPMLGTVLLHEWMHLLGFKHEWAVLRFHRANKIERLPPLPLPPITTLRFGAMANEAWADLGERLFGYDEALARETALAAPVHSVILWRRVEKTMRKVPKRLASTRHAELQARCAFMRAEVAPKARAARRRRWRRWWPGSARA